MAKLETLIKKSGYVQNPRVRGFIEDFSIGSKAVPMTLVRLIGHKTSIPKQHNETYTAACFEATELLMRRAGSRNYELLIAKDNTKYLVDLDAVAKMENIPTRKGHYSKNPVVCIQDLPEEMITVC